MMTVCNKIEVPAKIEVPPHTLNKIKPKPNPNPHPNPNANPN